MPFRLRFARKSGRGVLEGTVALIVSLLALPILPRIRWRHSVYVTIAAVIATWMAGWLCSNTVTVRVMIGAAAVARRSKLYSNVLDRADLVLARRRQ